MAKKNKGVRLEIERLFNLASEAKKPELARRYVVLARKKALRKRIPLRKYNRIHCRKCSAYWTQGNLQVRVRSGNVVYTCTSCGAIKRFKKE